MLFGIHRLTFANIALSLRRNQVNDSLVMVEREISVLVFIIISRS